MKKVTAYANANIALVKYWGKSCALQNIPAVSSLSMTLDKIGTTLTISSSPRQNHILLSSGNAQNEAQARMSTFLEQLRERFAFPDWLCVNTKSSVPFGAGLASSAAFFAALTLALDSYYALGLSLEDLSKVARLGSGSAARSIMGGFVGLYGGHIKDEKAHAFVCKQGPLFHLGMVIAIVETRPKAISSRLAMTITQTSSPFFEAWVRSAEADFLGAMRAIGDGSFTELGEIMEHSTLKMHATMWASRPFINYLTPKTVSIMNFVRDLRAAYGPVAYFTMDAGPNVKILCEAHSIDFICKALQEMKLCQEMRISLPGQGAQLLTEHLI